MRTSAVISAMLGKRSFGRQWQTKLPPQAAWRSSHIRRSHEASAAGRPNASRKSLEFPFRTTFTPLRAETKSSMGAASSPSAKPSVSGLVSEPGASNMKMDIIAKNVAGMMPKPLHMAAKPPSILILVVLIRA